MATVPDELEIRAPAKPPGLVSKLLGLRHSWVAVVGATLVLFWVVVAVIAPFAAPYDPNFQDFMALANPRPSGEHLLGTDMLGRDMLSRVMWGARTVLVVAPIAVVVAYLIGCTMGLLAGYFGGWVDTVFSRLADIVLSFPVIILYLIIIANFGASAFNIVLAVTFTATPQIMRIVRGLTLDIKNREYVTAAQIRGESALYIMAVEILPNARGPLIVDACLRMGYTIIAIGVLGFLGLGLPPPDPDWGGMVKDTYGLMSVYPHMALIPAAAISSLVIGFNLLADGIRELALKD
ncbi:ABC transporter permease [Geminicoccus harenae]|uniref:ABC transporter permease n=1 Tax=Geminicoccus harenae TaxID=2498453 RepID=UPI00168BB6E2|nr:ABC transporter permease [Geminicoccus harenae]